MHNGTYSQVFGSGFRVTLQSLMKQKNDQDTACRCMSIVMPQKLATLRAKGIITSVAAREHKNHDQYLNNNRRL